METTIPVSITVLGHALMQSVTVAWSAAGMLPQALCFAADGGTAQAQLTHEYPTSVVVNYRIQVSFAIPGWNLIEFDAACPVKTGGDRIVIDPGSWIYYLRLQWKISDEPVKPANVVDSIYSTAIADSHLVVNLTWQTAGLSRSIKSSQRIQPNQIWELPYLGISPQDPVTFTISAFGVIQQRMVRIPAISREITPLELVSSPRLLIASHELTSHSYIQLIHSTK
jgi:hypothetical protein